MEKEKQSVEEYERQGMEKYSYKFQEETLEETPNNEEQMSNNKQQTTVEWIEQEMLKPNLSMKEILNQAKEKEKNQHANTWDDSRVEDKGDNYIGKQKSFNDYYNEKYGGNK